MKKCILICVVFLMAAVSYGAKAVTLEKLNKPDFINVDDQHIIINENTSVYVYSAPEVKLKASFGKPGEGPQEFKRVPAPWIPNLFIYLQPDKILVNSLGKVSLFDHEGNFLREFKTNPPMANFVPMKGKYIGVSTSRGGERREMIFALYDSTFKKEKEVFRTMFPQQRGKKVNPLEMGVIKLHFYRQATKDKIFIPTLEGVFHVFDAGGKELRVIRPDYPEVAFSSEDEKKYDRFFSTSTRFKDIYMNERDTVQFPSKYPSMKDYRVDENKLYVITNKRNGDTYETLVFDHGGKLLGKSGVVLHEQDLLEVYPFDIHNGKVYQVVENEDEEEWELHVTEMTALSK